MRLRFFDYAHLYRSHLAQHLADRYPDGVPLATGMALGVWRTIAEALPREQYDDVVECVEEAERLRRRRPAPLLPDTFRSHLYGPLSVRFGQTPEGAVVFAASLIAAVHGQMPAKEFEVLLDCMARARTTATSADSKLEQAAG
ncbi:hypothetical protein [Streptomyces sp. NPDC006739]|uniref:hypothetical protein n=1 Tax=Streptomyces sp. NPDC006739 TaxID=3364763 RepID=UPI0036CEC75E